MESSPNRGSVAQAATLLHALDADRDRLQAEPTLSQIKLNELLNVVRLYKALGGGWQ